MLAFFVKSNENTYTKGRALMKTYIVVPITIRGNTSDVYIVTIGLFIL